MSRGLRRADEVARHVAGHAVVTLRLGGDLRQVRLHDSARGELESWELAAGEGFEPRRFLDRATNCLAGPVAEVLGAERFSGKTVDTATLSAHLLDDDRTESLTEDLQQAWRELSAVCGFDLRDASHDDERTAAWRWLLARTYRLVTLWESDIDRVSRALVVAQVLDGGRLRQIVFAETPLSR